MVFMYVTTLAATLVTAYNLYVTGGDGPERRGDLRDRRVGNDRDRGPAVRRRAGHRPGCVSGVDPVRRRARGRRARGSDLSDLAFDRVEKFLAGARAEAGPRSTSRRRGQILGKPLERPQPAARCRRPGHRAAGRGSRGWGTVWRTDTRQTPALAAASRSHDARVASSTDGSTWPWPSARTCLASRSPASRPRRNRWRSSTRTDPRHSARPAGLAAASRGRPARPGGPASARTTTRSARPVAPSRP